MKPRCGGLFVCLCSVVFQLPGLVHLILLHLLANGLHTETVLTGSPVSTCFEKTVSKGDWLLRQSTITGRRLQDRKHWLWSLNWLLASKLSLLGSTLATVRSLAAQHRRTAENHTVTAQVTGAEGNQRHPRLKSKSYNATFDILFSSKRLFSCPKIKAEKNEVLE